MRCRFTPMIVLSAGMCGSEVLEMGDAESDANRLWWKIMVLWMALWGFVIFLFFTVAHFRNQSLWDVVFWSTWMFIPCGAFATLFAGFGWKVHKGMR
jgi:hypothetical protein